MKHTPIYSLISALLISTPAHSLLIQATNLASKHNDVTMNATYNGGAIFHLAVQDLTGTLPASLYAICFDPLRTTRNRTLTYELIDMQLEPTSRNRTAQGTQSLLSVIANYNTLAPTPESFWSMSTTQRGPIQAAGWEAADSGSTRQSFFGGDRIFTGTDLGLANDWLRTATPYSGKAYELFSPSYQSMFTWMPEPKTVAAPSSIWLSLMGFGSLLAFTRTQRTSSCQSKH